MTDPHPVGDPHRAYRRVLKRAWRAEERVRELRAEIKNLRAQEAQE